MNTIMSAMDAEACREAEAIKRHRQLTGVRGYDRVKHWELRRGLEQLEDHRKFNALFREVA
jgi:hypothetical protein